MEWAPEFDVDEELARRLIAEQFPRLRLASIERFRSGCAIIKALLCKAGVLSSAATTIISRAKCLLSSFETRLYCFPDLGHLSLISLVKRAQPNSGSRGTTRVVLSRLRENLRRANISQ